jgi:RecB family exonuclease
MRVTAFRDYLACPYRFYLRHVLRLDSLDDASVELDPAGFGSLAHEVLSDFGRSDFRDSTDAVRLSRFLTRRLEARTEERFGPSVLPAVRVQVDQLRSRLHAFADWQARRAAAGWRIEEAELDVPEATLMVDGEPMSISGRIDRIDFHPGENRRLILDYKTSERARTPEEAHRKRDEWVDLQLPLYRLLLGGRPETGTVELGYLHLPKRTEEVGVSIATWSEEDLASADEKAREVVRQVREGNFWPKSDEPPPFSDAYRAICQDDLLVPIDLDEEEEDEEALS